MRNRSELPLRIEFDPIALDPQFPVWDGALHHHHADDPITYLHVHQALELGYCHSGSGVFNVAGKLMPFGPGSITVITASEPHVARSTPGTESLWSWIMLDPVRLLGPVADARLVDPSPLAGSQFLNVLPRDQLPAIAPVMLRMIAELTDSKWDYRSAIKALTWQLMIELKRSTPPTSCAAILAPNFRRIAPALDYLALHCAEPLRIAELARCCNMSEPNFRRQFRSVIGISPQAYLLDLRLHMACSLLRSSALSILTISQETGFETLSSFNRAFRACFKTSPREWRRAA